MADLREQLLAAARGMRLRLALLLGVPALVALVAIAAGQAGVWVVFYSVLALWLIAMSMWLRMRLRGWSAARSPVGHERRRIIAELREMRGMGAYHIEIARAAEIWAGAPGSPGNPEISACTRWLERAISEGAIEVHQEHSAAPGGGKRVLRTESLLDFFESDAWLKVGRDA